MIPVAPSPTTAIHHYLATKYVDHHRAPKWLNQCQKIETFDEALAKAPDANNIVFALHIPTPNKQMSTWFQLMLMILHFDVAFRAINQIGKRLLYLISVSNCLNVIVNTA